MGIRFRILVCCGAVSLTLLFPIDEGRSQSSSRQHAVTLVHLDASTDRPPSFNPYRPAPAALPPGALSALWEPLFIADVATGDLVPWLATSATPNAEFDRWTLTLRDGITWSDGAAFDAMDVYFTVHQLILAYPMTASVAAAEIRRNVASVTVAADHTVVFDLHAPNPRFAHDTLAATRTGGLLVVPRHVWLTHVGAERDGTPIDPLAFDFDPPVGTGPYRLVSTSAQEAVWERRDDWWGAATGFRDLPGPQTITFRTVADADEAVELLAAGEVDAGPHLDQAQFDAAKAANADVVGWSGTRPGRPEPCPLQLDFNAGAEPWGDPRLRRAVALTVDRTALAQAPGGTGVVADTLFPSTGAFAPVRAALVEAGLLWPAEPDEAAASNLLEDAGYARGATGAFASGSTPLTLALLADADRPDHLTTARAVAGMLDDFGIDTEVEAVTHGEFWGRRVPLGDFTAAVGTFACGGLVDPFPGLERYHSRYVRRPGLRSPGFRNMGRWRGGKAFDAAIDALGQIAPASEAVPERVVAAVAPLLEAAPTMPLAYTARIVPVVVTRWMGWPDATNPYAAADLGSAQGHRIIHALRAVPAEPD